jgi:hypothetical protein
MWKNILIIFLVLVLESFFLSAHFGGIYFGVILSLVCLLLGAKKSFLWVLVLASGIFQDLSGDFLGLFTIGYLLAFLVGSLALDNFWSDVRLLKLCFSVIVAVLVFNLWNILWVSLSAGGVSASWGLFLSFAWWVSLGKEILAGVIWAGIIFPVGSYFFKQVDTQQRLRL